MCQAVYFKTVYVLIIYVMQAFLVSQTELLTLWITHAPAESRSHFYHIIHDNRNS